MGMYLEVLTLLLMHLIVVSTLSPSLFSSIRYRLVCFTTGDAAR